MHLVYTITSSIPRANEICYFIGLDCNSLFMDI